MDTITLLRASDTRRDVTSQPSPARLRATGAALHLLVVGVADFDGPEWVMAADAVATSTQFDVASPDVELSVSDLVEFVGLTQPDAVVLDWSWAESAVFAATLLADSAAGSVPLMILSSDGEVSAERFRCGVWEDIRPTDFDDLVGLLGSYSDRTAFRRCVAALQVIDLFERLLAATETEVVFHQ